MNVINLKTGFTYYKEINERQLKIDKQVEEALIETNIDPKEVYSGNVDFISESDLNKYKYCAFVGGLDEWLVIQEMDSWEDVFTNYRVGVSH